MEDGAEERAVHPEFLSRIDDAERGAPVDFFCTIGDLPAISNLQFRNSSAI